MFLPSEKFILELRRYAVEELEFPKEFNTQQLIIHKFWSMQTLDTLRVDAKSLVLSISSTYWEGITKEFDLLETRKKIFNNNPKINKIFLYEYNSKKMITYNK